MSRASGWLAAGLALALARAPGAAADGARREVVFTGACDVSAVIPLDDARFLAADDEDSVLRVYDARRGGAPLQTFDLAPSLDLAKPPKALAEGAAGASPDAAKPEKEGKKGKKAKKGVEGRRAPETDLEAAARVGERAYWMTSHARNRSGERKAARLRFFATNAPAGADAVRVLGAPYEHLLDDLLAAPQLARFELARAAELAPKEPGGLNLEGLAVRPEGGLWLGFRNPLPGGRALLVPLLDPERVVEGEKARLGEPLLLELGGLGVRGMGTWRGRWLILAGSPDASHAAPRLYLWDGRGSRVTPTAADLRGLSPESLFAPDASERALVLSDDGSRTLDGKECKRLREPERKRFRGVWIALPPP